MKDMMWWMRQSGRELSRSPPAKMLLLLLHLARAWYERDVEVHVHQMIKLLPNTRYVYVVVVILHCRVVPAATTYFDWMHWEDCRGSRVHCPRSRAAAGGRTGGGGARAHATARPRQAAGAARLGLLVLTRACSERSRAELCRNHQCTRLPVRFWPLGRYFRRRAAGRRWSEDVVPVSSLPEWFGAAAEVQQAAHGHTRPRCYVFNISRIF